MLQVSAQIGPDLSTAVEDTQKRFAMTVDQFIKNPTAQVTQSVKQLKSDQRLALTGTPLENRLMDLWSITDFIQPSYLGDQDHFNSTYDVRGEGDDGLTAQRIARRRWRVGWPVRGRSRRFSGRPRRPRAWTWPGRRCWTRAGRRWRPRQMS